MTQMYMKCTVAVGGQSEMMMALLVCRKFLHRPDDPMMKPRRVRERR